MVSAVLRAHGLAALGADPLVEFGPVPFLDRRTAAGARLPGALRVGREAAPLVVIVASPVGRRDAHRALGSGRRTWRAFVPAFRHRIHLPSVRTAPDFPPLCKHLESKEKGPAPSAYTSE